MVNGASDSRDTGVLPLCGLTLVVDKVLPPIWREPPLCWWALQKGSATHRSILKVAHSAGVYSCRFNAIGQHFSFVADTGVCTWVYVLYMSCLDPLCVRALTPYFRHISFSIVLHLCWMSLTLWLQCGARGGGLGVSTGLEHGHTMQVYTICCMRTEQLLQLQT